MAMLGHFWSHDWTEDDKSRWVTALHEKARVATWPVAGLSPGPEWTKSAADFSPKSS